MRVHINTDQACKATLEFVPGEQPYIHFYAEHNALIGFIDDKDVAKLTRMVESLTKRPL